MSLTKGVLIFTARPLCAPELSLAPEWPGGALFYTVWAKAQVSDRLRDSVLQTWHRPGQVGTVPFNAIVEPFSALNTSQVCWQDY